MTLVADAVDRLDGRAAGGHDVLHHEAALARLERRALDPARQAVLLALLADEERLHVRTARERGAGDRVGAHRDAADRRDAQRARLIRHQLAEGPEALRPQDRSLRVDQVLRLAAAGEGHLADQERVVAQLADQPLARRLAQVDARGRRRRPWSQPSHHQSG